MSPDITGALVCTPPTALPARLFPWTPGEVSADLAACPRHLLHFTGVRLERLGPAAWWADLLAYHEPRQAPVTWMGFVLTRPAPGAAWDVAFPPYLTDVPGPWRELLQGILEAVATQVLDSRQYAEAVAIQVPITTPPQVPRPSKVGGDRITPGDTFTEIWLHHAKRYAFAAERARGLEILDLGCGVGYGSRMLSRVARRVTSVDLSAEAVTYAARAYASPRVRFTRANALALPFAPRSFDLVSCFEMMEHVTAHQVLLGEIARVLRPGGRLVISTPNKVFYADQPDPEHFHCGLLTLDEFRAHLQARFDAVELWSQPRKAGRPSVLDEFDVQPGADDGQEMFIGVATGPRVAQEASPVTLPDLAMLSGVAQSPPRLR